MADAILEIPPGLDARAYFAELVRQLGTILSGEPSRIARMSTIAAALGESGRFLWAGFYLVEGDDLVLGPFHGPLACFRIAKGRGVCGTAWARAESLLVPDVNAFPGHIACSALARSEIVVPVFCGATREVVAVLDVDHREIGGLGEADLEGLQRVAALTGR